MEIVVIMDRSGSMATCQSDMEGGLNSFLLDQKKINTDQSDTFTLAQFDTRYELVHDGIPLLDVPPIQLNPRGGTALLDAVGKTLATVRERRPKGDVIVMIVTDGEENASREWTAMLVKELVTKCESDGWQFVYLGANVDAFSESRAMGLGVNSTINYTQDKGSISQAFAATSENVRGARTMGTSVGYTISQREAIKPGEAENAANQTSTSGE